MLLFCTKMYLLIKDTLFHWRPIPAALPNFFTSRKTIYPAAIDDNAGLQEKPWTETGTKSAFVKCTFY